MQKWFASVYIICEILLLYLMAVQHSISLPLYVFGHFMASGFITFVFVFRGDRWLDLTKTLYAFLGIFCLPVIGVFQVLLLLPTSERQNEAEKQEEGALDLCEIDGADNAMMQSGRNDSRHLLHSLHDESYLELLLSARALPESQSLKLWGEAMQSTNENARLVGYCFSNELEEAFQRRLQQLLAEINLSKSKNIGRKHLLVAHLYWQHFRLGLLQEKDHLTVLKKIVAHSMLSIKLNETSPQSYVLLGEVMQLRKREKEAQYFFQKARHPSVVSPFRPRLIEQGAKPDVSSIPFRQAA